MAFFDYRFPERISRGAQVRPRFSTTQAKLSSGRRSVNRNWLYALQEYEVGHCLKSNADFEALRAFFYNVAGSFDAFRFKDPSDYTAAQTTSSLTLISGSIYQLNRIYVTGPRTYTRPIYKPVASTVVVRDAGGSALTATIDYTTGQADVTGTPSHWTGQFDVPVYFADDEAIWDVMGGSQMDVEWPSIRLVECRL